MKKKLISLILSLTLISTLLTGCGDDDTYDTNNKIKIVTSSYVVADFATQIGGDYVEVEVLLNSGENSQNHKVTNKDISKVNESDIFIHNGADSDPWIFDMIEKITNGNVLVGNSSESVGVKNDSYNINKADDKTYILNSKDPNKNKSDKDNSSSSNDSSNSNKPGSSFGNNQGDNNSNSSNKENSGLDNNENHSENVNGQNGNQSGNITEENDIDNNNTNDNELNKVYTIDPERTHTSSNSLAEISGFSTSAVSEDGYTLTSAPDGYKFKNDNLGNAVKEYLDKFDSGTRTCISVGSTIIVLKRDDFWGNSKLTTVKSLDDIELSQLNTYKFDATSLSTIKSWMAKSYDTSSFVIGQRVDRSDSNNKPLLFNITLMYNDDCSYYAVYNNGSVELFKAYVQVGKVEINYMGNIKSAKELYEAIGYENLICDSSSYSFLMGLNTNALTEKQQYHNYWMDINNSKQMVKNIYEYLCTKDEKHADYYLENYNNYIELLDSLDLRYKKMVENSTNKFVIITGEFNCFYLLKYLDLDYMSVYDYEYQTESPSIVRQSNIVEFINDNNDVIKYVISEGDDAITKAICEETGVSALEINSLNNIERKYQFNEDYSYISIMEANYIILKTVLN